MMRLAGLLLLVIMALAFGLPGTHAGCPTDNDCDAKHPGDGYRLGARTYGYLSFLPQHRANPEHRSYR